MEHTNVRTNQSYRYQYDWPEVNEILCQATCSNKSKTLKVGTAHKFLPIAFAPKQCLEVLSGSMRTGSDQTSLTTNSKRKKSISRGTAVQQSYKWSREEEIFLIGAIMNRFFTYGSLTSSRKGDDLAVWQSIKKYFDLARRNYYAGKELPRERSYNALHRHWKLMKAHGETDFYKLWKVWETRYKPLAFH